MLLDDFSAPPPRSHWLLHGSASLFLIAWSVFSVELLWIADRHGNESWVIAMAATGMAVVTVIWYRLWWGKGKVWDNFLGHCVSHFFGGALLAFIPVGLVSVLAIEFFEGLFQGLGQRLSSYIAAGIAGAAYALRIWIKGKQHEQGEADNAQNN